MSVRTSLLPGVCELRTPLAVIQLWLAASWLMSLPYADSLQGLEAVADRRAEFDSAPTGDSFGSANTNT